MKPNFNRNEYEKVIKFIAENSSFKNVYGNPGLVRESLSYVIGLTIQRGRSPYSAYSCGFKVSWADEDAPFLLEIKETLTEHGYIK